MIVFNWIHAYARGYTHTHAINNMISYLGFNILRTKIPLHNFLNSLKYPDLLVK